MIDLLTIEEAEKLPPEILQCKAPKDFDGVVDDEDITCCWWLRSPGYESRTAAFVGLSGDVCVSGVDVNCDYSAVRPALRILGSLLNTLPRTKKGYVIYLDTKWIDISEYVGSPCLLKKKCMKEAHIFDGKSNNYEESEIKEFIEDWYRRKVKESEIKEFIKEAKRVLVWKI